MHRAVGAQSLRAVKQIDHMLKDIPPRRLPTAQDVAKVMLWFSSPVAARRVTGQLISGSGNYDTMS